VDNSNEEGQLIYDLNRFNATLRNEAEATNNEELKSLYDLSSLIEERIRRFGI
jgi:DNA-binding SARP family transcriptional activator